jgi:hypothetical protein
VREEESVVGRTTSVRALGMVAVFIVFISDRAALSEETSRVRTEDPALSALIRRGTEDSATFRRLAETIQATDGLVYIVRGRCGHRVRACLVLWMGVASGNRILRVVVEDTKPELNAIASVAHELRHALEVLAEPSVRTSAGMFALYRRNGAVRSETFETKETVEIGNTVFNELRRSRSEIDPCSN